MYVGEVLHRQGWWVRKFDKMSDALAWCEARRDMDAGTVNPVREMRTYVFNSSTRVPVPPEGTFDEDYCEDD